MYLYARKFLYSWRDADETKRDKQIAVMQKLFPEMKGKEPRYVEFEMCYWRKANAIHKWFVENVQEGKDDCDSYDVDWEQLQQLYNDIIEVIGEQRSQIRIKKRAKDVLPTQSGFFFGGEKYDDYYFGQLERTRDMLKDILGRKAELEEWNFVYHSSW